MRAFLTLSLLLVAAPLAAQQVTPARTPAGAVVSGTAERFERAYFAWDAGHYDSALVELKAVLGAPDANAFHDRVAELTGEIYRTVEVAKDARAPRWSSDSRHLAYATGTGAGARVHIVRADAAFTPVADGLGVGAAFSPDGRYAAWLARSSSGTLAARVHDLSAGSSRDVAIDAATATGLTFYGAGPTRMAVLAGTAGASEAKLLVRDVAAASGTWQEIALGAHQPVELITSVSGSRLMVALGERGAFARSMPGFMGGSRSDRFAELTGVSLGDVTMGSEVEWSRDGRAYTWTERTETGARIRVRRGTERPTTSAILTQPFLAPALSPDGGTVAFAQMLREDWEIFTAPSHPAGDAASSAAGNAAGSTASEVSPTRITREIQHDLFPQFVSDNLLLAVIGEGRHRRSHLYDLTTGTRTRLFHNNSVRTVAPEYDWAVSPDGSRVAIVSERDGDTVTPHRHLYLTDLRTKVSRAELVARVDSNLTAERALRENGRRMFASIAPQVQAAVDEVSVGRIYSYEKALFDFDSKHITQPGNWKATEWLLEKYRSFGLEAHLQRFTTLQGTELEVANVVATVKGTVNPELVYVVGAHFDSRAEGPGADDNTSGTAMILEAARVLATRPLPATVMFVAFTGEESGLRGAREFGRRMKDSIHVVGALNNDMMGWSNDSRMDNTIRYSNPGIRDVQHAAAIHFSDLITYDAFYYKSTDAHALYDAWGDIVGGIGSYPILGNPHYHQVHDVLETINHRQLAETSRATVATIMLMASSPSRLTGLQVQGKIVTWDAAPEKEITGYVVRYGPPEDPQRESVRVTTTRTTIDALRAGWHVSVKAVNRRGMEGWDWARAVAK